MALSPAAWAAVEEFVYRSVVEAPLAGGFLRGTSELAFGEDFCEVEQGALGGRDRDPVHDQPIALIQRSHPMNRDASVASAAATIHSHVDRPWRGHHAPAGSRAAMTQDSARPTRQDTREQAALFSQRHVTDRVDAAVQAMKAAQLDLPLYRSLRKAGLQKLPVRENTVLLGPQPRHRHGGWHELMPGGGTNSCHAPCKRREGRISPP
ncbi:MAG TPA: hypothetical protein VJU79_05840 [Candidatus Dormibacteraeota bacterium]|nr:hypothetical protein [Candidatus Dormibacteraeota bacterium]